VRQDIRRQAGGEAGGLGEGGRRNRLEPNCGTPGVGAAMMLCAKKPTPSARSLQRPTYVQPCRVPTLVPTGRLARSTLVRLRVSFFELVFVFTGTANEIDFTNCVTFEPNRTERATGPCRVHAQIEASRHPVSAHFSAASRAKMWQSLSRRGVTVLCGSVRDGAVAVIEQIDPRPPSPQRTAPRLTDLGGNG
jgi:hypothetical protein